MVGTEGIAPSASCMSGRRSAAELRPDSNGGRDGTRTHFFHRDRVDSRLFVFTPRKLAPGAGVAPTPAASKAVELLLFDPGMVGRQGLAP